MSDDKIKSPLIPSNIPPPSELPSFVKQKSEENSPKEEESKKPDEIDASASDLQMQDIANALTPLTEGVKNSVIYSWMKDSLKTSIDIAKENVQKIVVTLDPQMSGILYSGGDIEVVVASTNEDKIDSAREAFQHVFGKATVYGKGSKTMTTVAAQPTGFESAEVAAKERINHLRSTETLVDKTILAVENFLLEAYKDQWFDVGLLLLCDPRHNITIKTFTQFTYIPSDIMKIIQSETPADYDKRSTGYGVTIGSVMAKYLNTVHYEWHEKYTGISRYDLILNAAKSLASTYKYELERKAMNQ